MAMKQMERGGKLDVFGTREYGQDVRTQNITAVSAVANIIKSSLGPVGLDKVRVPHEPQEVANELDLGLFGLALFRHSS